MPKLILFLLSFVLLNQNAFSFVHQRTIAGEKFRWPQGSVINLNVNGANSSGILSSAIVSRTQEAATEWNIANGPTLAIASTSSGPQGGRSDVFFSTNQVYFSSTSVLAVTESVFNEVTGRIIESDIIIKDSVLFSNSETSSPFIGDILSHELGHLLGLDHATMPFSTMFYKLTRGQKTTEYDDLLGINTLYESPSNSGEISGKIAGGDNLTKVFAADVQLISSQTGRVIATDVTDQYGQFRFKGIPLNDVYYLYIDPVEVKGSLSQFYQTLKTDFCTGFSSFQGGFHEACDNSRRGHPLGVHLTSSRNAVDMGTITIRCGLTVPLDYFSGRASGSFNVGNADREGDSFVGFFSQNEVSNGIEDVLEIDLSHVDTSSGDLFLDLRLLSQDFQSRVVYEIEVTSGGGTYNFNYTVDSDSNPNLNLSGRIPLDPFVSSNNIFTVRITPQDFDTFYPMTSFAMDSFFFPDFDTIGDNRLFYQFIYFISQSDGLSYNLVDHYSYPEPRGNQFCMEGNKTYSVKPAGAVTGITSESLKKRLKSDESPLACGSVVFVKGPRPPSNGLGNIILGVILGLMIVAFKRRIFLSF